MTELSTTVSGIEQYCSDVFKSELMEKIELTKFCKFEMKEIYRSKFGPEIPQNNIRLLTITDGFFMLVEPYKDQSTLYHIDRDPVDNSKIKRIRMINSFR